MKVMNQPSMSNPTHELARPWLAKHYEATRQRTVGLVKTAVDRLIQDGQNVTIEAICRQSQQLDPQGKGIKKAGILGNAEAYACYRQYCTSRHGTARRIPRQPTTTAYRFPTDPHRDLRQVRRRYLRAIKTAW